MSAAWPPVDLVIKSPGVPAESAVVSAATEKGIAVWSEVELAYALLPNPFDAITGTNGKTTTTALLGHLFATAGRPARVLGNIGTAVTSVAGALGPEEELVVEVSSFQLEDVHSFRPAVGVFLNLTPDHLDRHGTMERYLACKAKLFARQGPDDVAVLNLADEAVAGVGESLLTREDGPRVAFFSVRLRCARGGRADSRFVRGRGMVVARASAPSPGRGDPATRPSQPGELPGRRHGGPGAGSGPGSRGRGAAHVPGCGPPTGAGGHGRGSLFVNDSKATNVDATLTALNAYPRGTHLILGGRDKASDYRPVARACAGVCRAVYLIGEATPLIEAAFREVRREPGMEGVPEPGRYEDLERAVRAAARTAQHGEVVLLAPACASFDQYTSYEERGDHFRSLVAALQESLS